MFSALKKLTKGNDDRCPAPVPMSSSLQKKFSRGVHFNMKILIKGDRNVGKSCLLQRLQGGPFIEEYAPTEQIQVAPVHWTYKNTDHIVKVEVWEVVDKGRAKKKPPLGLKLENQMQATSTEDDSDVPVLDATFLDVYKNASGVILMMDITKPWTFEYVVKELSCVPLDLPVVILGNHCDMQHHRQVHAHHIQQAMHQAHALRTAPVRYAESSMRNGFGLRLLHKFLSIPFLRLQRTSLLEQLQRNQREMDEANDELETFQNSDEANYSMFVERLSNARRSSGHGAPPAAAAAAAAAAAPGDRAPSIVLGAGRPIVPPHVNPLVSQSLNSMGINSQNVNAARPVAAAAAAAAAAPRQTAYVSAELLNQKHAPGADAMSAMSSNTDSGSPLAPGAEAGGAGGGALEEFCAGALDTSFLEDSPAAAATAGNALYDSDSEDDGNAANPMVTIDQDDLDIEYQPPSYRDNSYSMKTNDDHLQNTFKRNLSISKESKERDNTSSLARKDRESTNLLASTEKVNQQYADPLDVEFHIWAADSSARRSPEGGEDPDLSKETDEKAKTEKKHKKKKSKDKDKDTSEKGEKKKKHKKSSRSEKKSHPQTCLLSPAEEAANFDYDDYDSL